MQVDIKVGLLKPRKGDIVRVEFLGEYVENNPLGEPIVRWEEGIGQWRSAILPKKSIRNVIGQVIEVGNVVLETVLGRELLVKAIDEESDSYWCQQLSHPGVYTTCHKKVLKFLRDSK